MKEVGPNEAAWNHLMPFLVAVIIAGLVVIVAKTVDFSQYISFG